MSTVPWHYPLVKSYKKNWEQTDHVYLPMCNIKRSGEIAMHNLRFQKILSSGFLQFTLAMNDHLLMGDIKSSPNAKLNWPMPKTMEYYNFKGKFYVASAPTQITRFPPPKMNEENAAEYWEQQRIAQWKTLDSQTRAMFTWPSRGEIPKSSEVTFSCQALNLDESVVHAIAMDNFCLLMCKVTHVEHFCYARFPPQRLIYTLNVKTGIWDTQPSNP